MLYDAVERVATVLGTNFNTDLAALCTAKSVAVPTAATLLKRMDANLHIALNSTNPALPALCIYSRGATSQASVESRRDNVSAISVDYFDRQAVANLQSLMAQVELAGEAILKSIDRMGQDSTTGVWGAGLPEGSAITVLSDFEDAPDGVYQRLLTMTFPVNDRDEV